MTREGTTRAQPFAATGKYVIAA